MGKTQDGGIVLVKGESPRLSIGSTDGLDLLYMTYIPGDFVLGCRSAVHYKKSYLTTDLPYSTHLR